MVPVGQDPGPHGHLVTADISPFLLFTMRKGAEEAELLEVTQFAKAECELEQDSRIPGSQSVLRPPLHSKLVPQPQKGRGHSRPRGAGRRNRPKQAGLLGSTGVSKEVSGSHI